MNGKRTLIIKLLILILVFVQIGSASINAFANEVEEVFSISFTNSQKSYDSLNSPDLNFKISNGFRELAIYTNEIEPLYEYYKKENFDKKIFYERIILKTKKIEDARQIQKTIVKELLFQIAKDSGLSIKEEEIDSVYSNIFDSTTVENDDRIKVIKRKLFDEEVIESIDFAFSTSAKPEKIEENIVKEEEETEIKNDEDVIEVVEDNQAESIENDIGTSSPENNHGYEDSGNNYQNDDVSRENEYTENISKHKDVYVYLQSDSGEKVFLKTRIKEDKIDFEKEKEVLLSLYKKVSQDEKIYLLLDKDKAMVSKDGKLLITKKTKSSYKSFEEVQNQFAKIQASLLFEKG